MVIVIDEQEVENVPENLEDFFDAFPSIGRANLELTDREHVDMWRDQVLFIRQRQQATSDFRENPKVRWIGKSIPEMIKDGVVKVDVSSIGCRDQDTLQQLPEAQ